MNRKAADPTNVIGIVISIILPIAGALLLFFVVFPMLGSMQQNFMDNICKFEVALRAVLLGNPVLQTLSGVFGFFTRGFATTTASLFSGLSLQSCTQGLSMQSTPEEPTNLTNLFKKIGDESARCWDLFGAGNWDSLLFSREGLGFTCWEDTVYLKCGDAGDEEDVFINGLYGYLTTNEYAFGTYSQLYYDIFPSNMPIKPDNDYMLTCNGTVKKYGVSITFIDKLLVNIGTMMVPMTCGTVIVGQLASDSLFICIRLLPTSIGGS